MGLKIKLREISVGEEEKWVLVGKQAYTDKPEFQEENILWPEIYQVPEEGRCLYLIAERGGEALGRLALREAPSSGIILDICVRPSFRREGVGKKLLEAAVGETKKWPKKEVRIMGYLDEEDLVGRSFFHSSGFRGGETHSVLIDLGQPPPSSLLEKEDMLGREGFVLRRLRAAEEDIVLAAELQEKYFPAFPGYISVKDFIERLMKKKFLILVMEKNGQPAGFVIGALDCTSRNYRHIRRKREGLLTSIAVGEDFRRKGIASALVLGLMRECKRAGDETLLYGGCGMNTSSMRLARSCGGERLRQHHRFVLKL